MENNLQSKKLLVIVESPNKVKTISSILKQAGYKNTTVTASVGHIMYLGDGGPVYNSGIYPKQKYKMNLLIDESKKKTVVNITKLAKDSDKIFLMTDGDREGEIIAWSLLKFCELPQEKCFRVITREITPKAIVKAIENPINFNYDLVNAGLVRMMVDKLIGYGLSPLGKKYLGAKSIGRCQSVGLKIISDREKEIDDFIPEVFYNIYLNFIKETISIQAKYFGYEDTQIEKFKNQADAESVVSNCLNTPFILESAEKVTHQEKPKAPFSTATFQQEAATQLGLKVKEAMSCAQKLFEGININGEHKGLITYMRTDSIELSSEFLPELQTFVSSTYGQKFYTGPRKIKSKSSDQNGHEAIRVVDPTITPEVLAKAINNNLLIKVYRLIWQRTIASVMPNAIISETIYKINNNGHKFIFSTKTLDKPGFKKIYKLKDKVLLPDLYLGEVLAQTSLKVERKFTQPKSRFTEAELVKELQRLEIGRPSTYATIVETLLSPTRGYAKLEEKYIIPTERGIQLAKYCDRSFPSLINLKYTKELEAGLDKIASGKILWLDYIENFYQHLQKIINDNNETGIASELPEKLCPNCGNIMVARRSRFGRLFYGCSTYPKCRGILNID